METGEFAVTIERFTGFGAHYDGVRPTAPEALAELLCPIAGCSKPELVVDLGSGTGLSTRYWSGRADRVIGVEPTDSMREAAVAAGGEGVSYVKGFSHATGLPDGCADLVVCGQSLHWMEPQGTFEEARRVLRPGGVFAAYDFDWPPSTGSWEVDRLYTEVVSHCHRLETEHGVSRGLRKWEKSGHLARLEESGCFRYTRECLLHHREQGTAERVVGLLLSQGHVQTLRKAGFSEEDLRVDELREVARRCLGGEAREWFWSARVRLGVQKIRC